MICYYDVFDWSCSLFPLSHRLIAITITLWGTTSCLMYCVTDFARIADGTGSSLVSASLQSFIGFPLCHDWFCRYCASHYPLPVSGSNRCCSYHPFRSAHASAVWLGLSCLNIRSMVGVPSRSFSGLLDSCGVPFSFYPYPALCWCALSTLLFHFHFNLGVILIYSPRSYEAGACFYFRLFRGLPHGLGQWFFHESSFFFTDKSLPMGNKQNVYSQINPRRTTFPRRLVASNKLNINQLKFRNYEKV